MNGPNGSDASTSWGNVHRLRYEGFSAGCQTRPERWVACEERNGRSASADWPGFLRWVRHHLTAAQKPLAVLCYDETDAARLLYATHEIGISVPEDVAILSIGNDPLVCENQSVPISSIDQNLYKGGYEAAAMLDRLMRKKCRAARVKAVRIPPVGVVTRRSTDVLAVADAELRRAVQYITENLDRRIGAPQIAQGLGISRPRLEKQARAELGHSIGVLVRKMRFAKACTLLRTTELTVGEIASRTGFCHQSHLTNAFRKTFGKSPNAWRRDARRSGA